MIHDVFEVDGTFGKFIVGNYHDREKHVLNFSFALFMLAGLFAERIGGKC
jgi:hypothetical protein